MKKTAILVASLLAATACTPTVPDSGQGVGFNDYAQYDLERARREAALAGRPAPTLSPNGAIVPPNSPVGPDGISSSELAAAGIQTGGPVSVTPNTPSLDPMGVTPDPMNVTPANIGSNPEISDEQNFRAVASRETIESDAERRARQAAAYQLIEVTALPDRSGNMGPNIVQYALQAPNNRGESVFDRSGFNSDRRFQRNCAEYRTPDDAQRDFLVRGGPSSDRRGLDPDGDGFACGWDPQPFRALASGN